MNIQTNHHTECALLRVPADAAGSTGARAEAEPFAYAMKKNVEKAAASSPQTYGVGARITCVDRALIRRFFDVCYLTSTPCVTEKTNQKAGARPAGRLSLRSRMEPLPTELEYRLSQLKSGYRRVLMDCDVLLIEATTRSIVDVMRNAAAVPA